VDNGKRFHGASGGLASAGAERPESGIARGWLLTQDGGRGNYYSPPVHAGGFLPLLGVRNIRIGRRQIATRPPPKGPSTRWRLFAQVLGESSTASSGAAFMYKASKRYLTVSVSTLIVAILISLATILVRGVVVPAMDGKIAADGTVLELRKSLP
jgi:hypothetical protein